MAIKTERKEEKSGLTFEEFKSSVLADYRLAVLSREISLIGRKEVLTGKAKFGIFGDGKELPQLAMARVFKNGDFRSGYYRDQTFILGINALTPEQWFAGLYAHADKDYDPTSGGRQMGGHFATRSLEDDGTWKNLMEQKNSSADISPTGGQMPRLLGLAQASKVYRHISELTSFSSFSHGGNEIAFGTIGDASTSEGLFWETMNAAAVLQVPLLMSVWDDGHGISVPKKYQTAKESISEALAGFQRTDTQKGFEIFRVKGWDYPALCETYEAASALCRKEHVPCLIHVEEVTQPQGHSTSGSHERYKSKERLQWETEFDGIVQMKKWIITAAVATEDELQIIEQEAKSRAKEARQKAWNNFLKPMQEEKKDAVLQLQALAAECGISEIAELALKLDSLQDAIRKDIHTAVRIALRLSIRHQGTARIGLSAWLHAAQESAREKYSSHLFSESKWNIAGLSHIPPQYENDSKVVDGREVIRDNFDTLLSRHPELMIFGEDVGKIGDVNQGCEKLQEKYGEIRVSDTGIREATIMGQGIGLAMRGLRPIAEIQYLDYFLYGLQIISDDLATVQYRTKGGQKAPLIIRTRGHRLEGIWHSGSPMGTIIHALRGVHVCVPRDMTRAAGFYNALLKSDEPALVVEPLNGYRLKERLPLNLGDFTTPFGIPEILKTGNDLTIVSYGSTLRIVQDVAKQLMEHAGIDAEVIDVQTLLPFDTGHIIVESLKKTGRLLVVDEDVPGGASAYIMQQILEVQEGYYHLDSKPVTLSAQAHRPAYGSDGDYFSKPSAEDIFDVAYGIMHEANPGRWPAL